MKDQTVIELGLQAILLSAKLCAPLLLTSLAIGFGISLFQSVTQIQEATLSFVPKAIGIGVVIVVCGNWMLHELVSFTTELYTRIPVLLTTG
ncbi:flagellar biosynthetic protein FliQ [Angustibacter aerolatus]